MAIDKACADLVNKAPVLENSVIGKKWKQGADKFDMVFPATNWKSGLQYAEELGLGTQKYELIEVK